MAKRKPKIPQPPEYPMSFETFRKPAFWERRQLEHDAPSCFNGMVQIRKYRVTFEEVVEPVEALGARLQKLWEESDNHHHFDPLMRAAAAIGYTFQGQRGAKRKRPA